VGESLAIIGVLEYKREKTRALLRLANVVSPFLYTGGWANCLDWEVCCHKYVHIYVYVPERAQDIGENCTEIEKCCKSFPLRVWVGQLFALGGESKGECVLLIEKILKDQLHIYFV